MQVLSMPTVFGKRFWSVKIYHYSKTFYFSSIDGISPKPSAWILEPLSPALFYQPHCSFLHSIHSSILPQASLLISSLELTFLQHLSWLAQEFPHHVLMLFRT